MDILRIEGPEPQSSFINRLADAFARDERVLACWMRGSFATGTTDRYSDMDMTVAVDDEHFHYAFESVRDAAHGAGEPLVSWDSPRDINGSGFTCFYSDCSFLDVKVYRASRAQSVIGKEPARVVFDRTGDLLPDAQSAQQDGNLGPSLQEHVQWKMQFLCLCAFSAVRYLKREEYWYAAGMINAVRGTLAQVFWLWEHPDKLADMSFIVWGVVRRDLSPSLRDELASTVPEPEKTALAETLGKLLDSFRRHGPRIAADTGTEYPDRLVETVTGFYRRECGA